MKLIKNKKELFQAEVLLGKFTKGVKIFERPDLDLIRLYNPNINVSAFIGSYNLEEVVTKQ